MPQLATPVTPEDSRILPERNLRMVPTTPTVDSGPILQAHRILRFGFTVAPVLAGLDKFFHTLVNWDQYLAPQVNNILGGRGHEFMFLAGVVEIIAGLGVALRPRIFSYIVGVWLLCIVVNLLLTGQYFDIALRDFGLALGAFALGRLSESRIVRR